MDHQFIIFSLNFLVNSNDVMIIYQLGAVPIYHLEVQVSFSFMVVLLFFIFALVKHGCERCYILEKDKLTQSYTNAGT